MKKSVILSAVLIFLFSSLFAQENDSTKKSSTDKKSNEFQTLFGNNRPSGAYGAFSFGYSEIDNNQAIIFGGKFEWIVGHSIGFGFGGTGFVNEYHYDPQIDLEVFLTGGYGGFIVEPIFLPKFPVHLSFPILLGVGGISYITKDEEFSHNIIEDSEVFLIAEPSAELEFNITRHFRFAIGASYRFTTPFDVGLNGSTPVNAKAIENWSYLMTFKFGRF
jgi:hypothetical protein